MRTFRRLLVPAVVALFAGVFLVSGAGARTERGVLYDKASTYPRVVQLEHSGLANGRILSSVNGWSGRDGIGVIQESLDGGRSFHRLATIHDPAAAGGKGICCSDLYELPQRVGWFPEGTLLWADNVGFGAPEGSRSTSLRLWASTDNGRSWSFVSTIATSPNRYNIWEPNLEVAADGSLVAFYSDESDKPRHDQKLVQVRSYDGRSWGDQRETVVDDDPAARPGMASSLRLPNGTYLLAYEVCNVDFEHQCRAAVRASSDGWDYGDPRDPGTVVRTPDGKYTRHTPSLAWSPQPAPNGTVLLAGEMLVNADGSVAPGNGRTVLGNTHLGAGTWDEMPAPVPVQNPHNGHCKNFSPSLAALGDGSTMIETATDLEGGVCKTYYGTGAVGRS